MPPDSETGLDPGRSPHRSKALAAWAALLGGWIGLHRRYLESSVWWLYPMIALPAMGWALRTEPWFRQPGFFVFALVGVISMVEAIVIALTADERWDVRYNPSSGRRSSSGWAAVIVAVLALICAAMLGMTTMAIALEAYFLSKRGG